MSVHFRDDHNRADLQVGNTHIILEKKADYVHTHADFLVNPAQPKLTGGGGLDAVIHKAAGPALKQVCKQIPCVHGKVRCPTGEVRITHGANLGQPYVLHTVGPEIKGKVSKEDKQKLRESYKNCLEEAERFCKFLKNPGKPHPSWMNKVHSPKDGALKAHLHSKQGASVAFCCISTGSYSYPADKAAKVAVKTLVDFAKSHPKVIREIRICCAAGQKDIPHLVSEMRKVH